jgi:single-strand DNA-binding protein
MELSNVTIAGNLTADPELRYTSNGRPVVDFTIAASSRRLNKQTNQWEDGDTTFLRASAWRDFAENIAGSLRKGDRVIATGRLKQRNYQDREGNNRTSLELDVDELGASLKRATAVIMKTTSGQTPAADYVPEDISADPWTTANVPTDSEVPF